MDFIIGEHWGMDSPLAYTDPANTHEMLLRGANFASAGAGILNDTGLIFVLTWTQFVHKIRIYWLFNLDNHIPLHTIRLRIQSFPLIINVHEEMFVERAHPSPLFLPFMT